MQDDQVGLKLIRDILAYNDREGNEVSTSAGTAISKLSFQRGYMKLFAVRRVPTAHRRVLKVAIRAVFLK